MNKHNRYERAQDFSLIWSKSRTSVGKSQEFMALGLGVSKKTIQNWEKGISSPNFFQGSEWFRLLGLNPLPYYLEFIYSKDFFNTSDITDSEELNTLLMDLIITLPLECKQQLLFLLSGSHGSSPISVLQLMMAHLQTPLMERVSHANMIMTDYDLAKHTDRLNNPEEIQPNLHILNKGIQEGRNSAISGGSGYTISAD